MRKAGFRNAPAGNSTPPTRDIESEMTDFKRSLTEGIAKLFNNPTHSDVKIYIGEHELPAHAIVLTSQSLFFEKALSEKFREGQTKEFVFKEEGRMHAHWRVFEYMYTGSYSEEPAQALGTQDDHELVKDVRVYVTADFFLLADLKQYALARFKSKLERFWKSELLVDCIREIYTSTTESERRLRTAVVETVIAHRAELWKKKSFQDLARGGGDFVVELMGVFCASTGSTTSRRSSHIF
ncbi:BTB/POZ domain-containing protein [Nemania abortiva]|nr:BTB/POZ domain-containing protein [Nemania abortiva]